MKKRIVMMNNRILPAILSLGLMLSCFAVNTDAHADNDDSSVAGSVQSGEPAEGEQAESSTIRLSNTKFPGMANLTEEESSLLQAATDMLSAASIETVGNKNSSYGTSLLLENTSGADMSYCEVHLLFFDASGTAIDMATETLNEWKNGEKFRTSIQTSPFMNGTYSRAQIELRFQTNEASCWYRTGLQPLRFAGEAENGGSEEIRVRLRDPLPRQYTVLSSRYGNSVYTLSDFESAPAEYDEYYRFRMLVTKISGPYNHYERVYCRLVRSDGVIVGSTSVCAEYLKPGYVFLVDAMLYVGGPGDYTLEFIEIDD